MDENFQLPARRGLAVYMRNRRVLPTLRHYGHLTYVSRHAHYAILYVDQAAVQTVTERLLKLHNVIRVRPSIWPDVDPTVTQLTTGNEQPRERKD